MTNILVINDAKGKVGDGRNAQSEERPVPYFSEDHKKAGDVVVDSVIEPPELEWKE